MRVHIVSASMKLMGVFVAGVDGMDTSNDLALP